MAWNFVMRNAHFVLHWCVCLLRGKHPVLCLQWFAAFKYRAKYHTIPPNTTYFLNIYYAIISKRDELGLSKRTHRLYIFSLRPVRPRTVPATTFAPWCISIIRLNFASPRKRKPENLRTYFLIWPTRRFGPLSDEVWGRDTGDFPWTRKFHPKTA